MMNQINVIEDAGISRTGGILVLVMLVASAGWFLYKRAQNNRSPERKSNDLLGLIKSFFTNYRKTNIETLTFREVVGWFVSNQDNYVTNESVCGFSLSSRINGKYETIQGFFDKTAKKILVGRVIISSGYDDELNSRHKDNELVIYE